MIKKIPPPIQYLIIAIFLSMVIGVITIDIFTSDSVVSPSPTPNIQVITTSGAYFEEKTEITTYTKKAIQILGITDNTFNVIAEILGKESVWSNEDIYSLGAVITIMKEGYIAFYALTPPESLVASYQKQLNGLKLCNEAMSILQRALDDSDTELFHKSRDLLFEAWESLRDGTKIMWTVTEDFRID